MKKVFIVHGLGGAPNSSWFPWLMSELKLLDIWACSLNMPNPDKPVLVEWLRELDRGLCQCHDSDEIFLVGHSLGIATIMNYLQSPLNQKTINGVVLVSGRFEPSPNPDIAEFYPGFDFEVVKSKIHSVRIIHGDDDKWVDVSNAYSLANAFGVEPVIIENGGHLVGSQGWRTLPACLEYFQQV
jgi:predicted alpha/beta hydrolase family esterase